MQVNLEDGFAQSMGDGYVTVMQADEYGAVQSVVINASDLALLMALSEGSGGRAL